MVQLREVQMQFEEKIVLEGVSLDVQPQERLVIMGQSGSGKSTILRLILGILRPNAGSIFFKQFEIALTAASFNRCDSTSGWFIIIRRC